MSVATRRGDARRRALLLAAPVLLGLGWAWTAGAESHPVDAAPTLISADIVVVGGVAGAIPGAATAGDAADRLGGADPDAAPGTPTTATTAPGAPVTTTAPASSSSVRTFGTGSGGIDRVVVPLSASTRANIGATDFTIELWVRGTHDANPGGSCTPDLDGWITGRVVLDRDVYGQADRGDFGISLHNGRVAVGVARGTSGITLCGTIDVLDGSWHHVAVTRRMSDGRLRLWVDGRLDGSIVSTGAQGDVSYRVGRATTHPADATLVLGAEKHDAGANYPSFAGWIDEVRLSTVVRYDATFTPPATAFAIDAATASLWHFDEAGGTTAADAVGTSPATLAVGGPSAGPQWQSDSPFG